jgi:hypothetical protein
MMSWLAETFSWWCRGGGDPVHAVDMTSEAKWGAAGMERGVAADTARVRDGGTAGMAAAARQSGKTDGTVKP